MGKSYNTDKRNRYKNLFKKNQNQTESIDYSKGFNISFDDFDPFNRNNNTSQTDPSVQTLRNN